MLLLVQSHRRTGFGQGEKVVEEGMGREGGVNGGRVVQSQEMTFLHL